MHYNGITGSVEYSEDGDFYRGKLLHIDDLVTYQADDFKDLYAEFVAAVDDWRKTRRELDDS